jgi:hypothetical protein
MASLLARTAGAFSFAHLMGGLSARAKRAEDDDKKPEDTDEEEARAEEEQPEHYDDDGKGKKGAKAEDEDDDKEAASDDDEKKDEPKDDAKKSKRAAKDDDDDEEMKKAKAAGFGPALQAARRAERTRIGHILSAPEAANRVATAAHLACNTDMTASAAIGLLKTVPAEAKGRSLAERMGTQPRIEVGADGGKSAGSPGQRLVAATKAAVETDTNKRKARR